MSLHKEINFEEEICHHLGTNNCPCFDTLVTQSSGAIDLLQEHRTALISAAITGKIDVRPGFKTTSLST